MDASAEITVNEPRQQVVWSKKSSNKLELLKFGSQDQPILAKWDDVSVKCHHDEDVEIYINGVLAASAGGFTSEYELLPLNLAGRAAFRPGKNVIAVHCKQTTGGQYIDVGFARAVKERKKQ